MSAEDRRSRRTPAARRGQLAGSALGRDEALGHPAPVGTTGSSPSQGGVAGSVSPTVDGSRLRAEGSPTVMTAVGPCNRVAGQGWTSGRPCFGAASATPTGELGWRRTAKPPPPVGSGWRRTAKPPPPAGSGWHRTAKPTPSAATRSPRPWPPPRLAPFGTWQPHHARAGLVGG